MTLLTIIDNINIRDNRFETDCILNNKFSFNDDGIK